MEAAPSPGGGKALDQRQITPRQEQQGRASSGPGLILLKSEPFL